MAWNSWRSACFYILNARFKKVMMLILSNPLSLMQLQWQQYKVELLQKTGTRLWSYWFAGLKALQFIIFPTIISVVWRILLFIYFSIISGSIPVADWDLGSAGAVSHSVVMWPPLNNQHELVDNKVALSSVLRYCCWACFCFWFGEGVAGNWTQDRAPFSLRPVPIKVSRLALNYSLQL